MPGPLPYIPYQEVAGRPHIVVDGSVAEGTVLCLSHWPGTACPAELKADLSAQMAFAYLDRPAAHGAVECVTNNHFDQDGAAGLYALVQPTEAERRRSLLVEVARAGDFAAYRDRAAARISMVLSAFCEPERSPLAPLPATHPELTAVLYHEVLPRLGQICDDPDGYRDLWAEEDAVLAASESALAGGRASIEEVSDIDLAIVRIGPDCPDGGGHRFAAMKVGGLHPMAIHNATGRFVILAMRGRRYELTCRYESWVQYQSRPVRARRDLRLLADRFNQVEASGGTWRADGPGSLTPTLALEGAVESTIQPVEARTLVEGFLRSAPAGWDPSPRA
jgi:Family of unknown function (DUF6687)